MTDFEVSEPILNSPYEEPKEYWHLQEGSLPEKKQGRRPAGYYYSSAKDTDASDEQVKGKFEELTLVSLLRQRVKEWRTQHYPGASRTTIELLDYWQRDGRFFKLFFAQIEAVETVIFLTEARSDFLQGINVPREETNGEIESLKRYACKMATGTGKTMVMALLSAWSILNKTNNRGDSRFSDVILVVCPNVTIKNRLQELNPELGEASIYRTRDLVPKHLLPDLAKGKVLVTNWHVFQPQSGGVGETNSRVIKAGVPVRIVEWIRISDKSTVARGKRYLSQEDLDRQTAAGLLNVLGVEKDEQGNTIRVKTESTKYVESDSAVINRVLGREIGGKKNILVFNDECHHAYRILYDEESEGVSEEDFDDAFVKEATVWVDGLDRINKLRGINFCVDFSATPYFLSQAGQETNKIFPWTISDFGLTDAIESGLVKIPQLAVRDTTGEDIAKYFNIWRWILEQLTPTERGAKRESPKPEAILKWAHSPIAMLAGFWEELRKEWSSSEDKRPPVFIMVCKNVKIAQVVYEWLAEEKCPLGIPPISIDGFKNSSVKTNTIIVHSRLGEDSDSGAAKSDQDQWMRFTLDTVGKLSWPSDSQGMPIYPEGFKELAGKLKRPLDPPGKEIRCIISVGMLTEGWDCNTVTHIVGLRPFMSQLLCEQVVGRGLRRTNYEIGENGLLTEEVAKVLGVPFEIIPFKQNKGHAAPKQKKIHIHAIPGKSKYLITFPRVEGYRQAIRNKITVDWNSVPTLHLDPQKIPPEVELKHGLLLNKGRPSLLGPGRLENINLNPYRANRRLQEVVFEVSRDITKEFATQNNSIPAQVLFPQVVKVVEKYLETKVNPISPAKLIDVSLSPYYGWVVERVKESIRPDSKKGEAPEIPRYEESRGPGSTENVDFWTNREVREAIKSHVNYVVADTKQWEQSAAYIIDTHPSVQAFVKNAGLGFSIPYLYNGQGHDYIPDFIIRLNGKENQYLIIETKGFDELKEIKAEAAERWVKAVNADGKFGNWKYALAESVPQVRKILDSVKK